MDASTVPGLTVNLQVTGHFYGRTKFILFYVTLVSSDEVYCRETKEPEVESWSMSDVPVIVLVILLLLAILVGLACALRRYILSSFSMSQFLYSRYSPPHRHPHLPLVLYPGYPPPPSLGWHVLIVGITS